MLKVKVWVVNEGTTSQYFSLATVPENQVLYTAKTKWKTAKGAKRWAEKRGFEVVKEK